jgi:hypothetical protein
MLTLNHADNKNNKKNTYLELCTCRKAY